MRRAIKNHKNRNKVKKEPQVAVFMMRVQGNKYKKALIPNPKQWGIDVNKLMTAHDRIGLRELICTVKK